MLKTFLMAMVPIIELRGAIPYGAGIAGLPIWQAALIAVLGTATSSVSRRFYKGRICVDAQEV